MNKKIKYSYFSFVFLIMLLGVYPETKIPKNVEKIVNSAFKQKSSDAICKSLESKIGSLKSPTEKSVAYSILADYEDRCEFFYSASRHYIKASELALPQNKKALLIKAMASALLASKTSLAYDICNEYLLPQISEKKTKDDIKVLVYSEWIKLKLLENNEVDKIDEILATLQGYVRSSAFVEFHPAILLTLWWVDNDKKAENTLLKRFPNSLEAGIVRGSVVLSPKVFWYLMPRAQFDDGEDDILLSDVESSAGTQSSGAKQAAKQAESGTKLYQVGFFKSVDNAKKLADKLSKKGFSSLVRKKTKKTGVFYSVLVKKDKKGDIVLRLKNEGYEAVPIF